MTFEDIVNQIGWGLYNKTLVALCSIFVLSNAVIFGNMPVILSFGTEDFDNLSLSEYKILNNVTSVSEVTMSRSLRLHLWQIYAIFLVGMCLGSVFNGVMTDLNGRKLMIVFQLGLVFATSLCSMFSSNNVMFYTSSFLLGCAKMYLLEFTNQRNRALLMVFLDLVWYIGLLLVYQCNRLLVPDIIDSFEFDLRMMSWRVLFGLAAFFVFLTIPLAGILQKSARFLLVQKKFHSSFFYLFEWYSINNSKRFDNFPIRERDLINLGFKTNDFFEIDDFTFVNYVKEVGNQHTYLLQQICQKAFRNRTIVLLIFYSLMFCRIEFVPIFLSEILQTSNLKSITFKHENCLPLMKNGNFDEFFQNMSICTTGSVVGLTILLAIIGKLKRTIILGFSGCLCAFFAFALSSVTSDDSMHLIESAFVIGLMANYTIMNSVLDLITMESYPTMMRSTAYGALHSISYLMCVVMLLKIDLQFIYCLKIFGSLMLFGSIFTYFLNDFYNKPVQE